MIPITTIAVRLLFMDMVGAAPGSAVLMVADPRVDTKLKQTRAGGKFILYRDVAEKS